MVSEPPLSPDEFRKVSLTQIKQIEDFASAQGRPEQVLSQEFLTNEHAKTAVKVGEDENAEESEGMDTFQK